MVNPSTESFWALVSRGRRRHSTAGRYPHDRGRRDHLTIAL